MGLFDFLKPVEHAAGKGLGFVGRTAKDMAVGTVRAGVTVGADVANAIGNAEIGTAHAFGFLKDRKTQTNEEQFGHRIGSFVGPNSLRSFAGNTTQIGLLMAGGGIGSIAEKAGLGLAGAIAPEAAGVAARQIALRASMGLGEKALPGVFGAGARIGAATVGGALFGAPQSVAQTVAGTEPLTPKALLKSAVTGGLGGAAVGGVTGGLGEAWRNQQPKLSRLTKDEAGHLNLDAFGRPLLNKAKEADPLINEYAAHLKDLESGMKGGMLIDTAEGKTRISEHNTWYRDFYKENKRAPTNLDWYDIAEKQVKDGTASPDFMQYYKEQTNPEFKSLAESYQGSTSPTKTGEVAVQPNEGIVDTSKGPSPIPQPRIHPEDQQIMSDFIDHVRGVTKLSEDQALKLEHDASRTAEHYGLPTPNTRAKLAKVFDKTLMESKYGKTEQASPTPVRGERQFLKTAQNSPMLSGDTKVAIAEINPKYTPRQNEELYATAVSIVDKNPALAREKAINLSGTKFDENVAIGIELIRRDNLAAQAAKDSGDMVAYQQHTASAAKLAEEMAHQATELGRGVQAHALMARLTPEGQLIAREQQVARLREAHPNAPKEAPLAGEIQGDIEKAGQVSKQNVRETVHNIANDMADGEKQPKSVGEQVASRIASQVDPKIKKQADTLVQEITKKIQQEQLAPKTVNRKSAIDLLREVFARNGEAQDAYPEAQNILYEKFQDNPNALKALDKFFTSELGLPAAGTTINRSIKEQLSQNETSIADIISKSWANQKQSVEDVTNALTQHGFDETSAKQLATEIKTRLDQQVADAKTKVLEGMAKITDSKQAKSIYAEKITKLSNLGALDNQDYLDLARGKLKLPNLTAEQSAKISELAQKMQGLENNDPQKYLLAKQIGEVTGSAVPTSLKEKAIQVLGAPRAVMASTDISGMGRQGLFLGTKFKKEFGQSFVKQAEYFKSADAYEKGMAQIATDKDYARFSKAGAALTGVSKRPEEVFQSTMLEGELAKKLGVGHVLEASDRGYTGALTHFRFNVMKNVVSGFETTTGRAMTDKELESLAHYVNVSTGRGGSLGGFMDKHGETLSLGLFSPRLWASRLEVLSPKYYYDLKGPARALALKNAGNFAAMAGSVLTLASLAGAHVETDARSSDFLKIKVGDSRYDILGGFQQNLVFAWRELSGEKKSSTSGQITKLGQNFGGANRFTILSDLVQNKENPVVSTASTLIAGKDKGGQPINPATTVGKLFIPLTLQEIASGIKHYGVAKGVASAAPGFIGIGAQTYGLKDINVTQKQKDYLDNLKTKNAPPEQIQATKEFFQTAKTLPNTDMVMSKIKDAINAGDNEAVKKYADEYNKSYVSAFKSWGDKYGKQYTSKDLLKVYQNGMISGAQVSRAASKIQTDKTNKAKGIVAL